MKDFIFSSLISYCYDKFKFSLANAVFGSNECDMFAIKHSGYTEEFEVKVSRSDFFADKKKLSKHKRYNDCYNNKNIESFVPNYFSYVCPYGLIKEKEVPEYAGLAYIKEGSKEIYYIKNPPLLHKQKTNTSFMATFAEKLYHRYHLNVYRPKIIKHRQNLKNKNSL